MAQLVRLPPAGAGAIWINPEHVVSVAPVTQDIGERFLLTVEVKLVGMNLIRLPVGQYESAEDRTAAWTSLLGMLST